MGVTKSQFDDCVAIHPTGKRFVLNAYFIKASVISTQLLQRNNNILPFQLKSCCGMVTRAASHVIAKP